MAELRGPVLAHREIDKGEWNLCLCLHLLLIYPLSHLDCRRAEYQAMCQSQGEQAAELALCQSGLVPGAIGE